MGPDQSIIKRICLFLGPALAGILVLQGPPDGLSVPAWATGALLIWMAIWWATEPVPIPVTSLLPIVILPLFDVASPKEVASGYAHHIVLLLFGGFLIALGIEKWGLHKRIALAIVVRIGTSPRALIAGFMIATAVLSMWISNTATTLMMVPIAISAAAALRDDTGRFITALLLGICYAASIGGVGTPIGTPTNLIAIDWLYRETGNSIGFPQWMAFGIPAVSLLLPAAWWGVSRKITNIADGPAILAAIQTERKNLGRMTAAEARVAILFGIVAFLWVNRIWLVDWADAAGWPVLAGYSGAQIDMMIALGGAVAAFIIPAGQPSGRALLTWQEAERIPWGVLLLFGGGIAMGNSIRETGLSEWIGLQMGILSTLPTVFFIITIVLLVIFLTELTSNVATMTTLAPILGTLATAIDAPHASLLAPAAVAASCAFMLPVATAPNAIIYATGQVSMGQMMSNGLRINLIAVLVISAIGLWLAPLVL